MPSTSRLPRPTPLRSSGMTGRPVDPGRAAAPVPLPRLPPQVPPLHVRPALVHDREDSPRPDLALLGQRASRSHPPADQPGHSLSSQHIPGRQLDLADAANPS